MAASIAMRPYLQFSAMTPEASPESLNLYMNHQILVDAYCAIGDRSEEVAQEMVDGLFVKLGVPQYSTAEATYVAKSGGVASFRPRRYRARHTHA